MIARSVKNYEHNRESEMERWAVFAVLSMVLAGFTSVIAKNGLVGITGEVGLLVRTCFVFLFIVIFAFWGTTREQLGSVSGRNLFWLGLSGLTTTLSWIFYYKALKLGDVSKVALIDKGSFVVTLALAWLLLGERISPRVFVGGVLIFIGMLVVARK